MSETWLDSTTSIDSNDLSLKCYNLHHIDDPDNVKKGGVCVYYKETLAVQCLETKSVNVLGKKAKKQILNNYRSVSLLPICSKLFEKLIFHIIFQHITINKLLNANQSFFIPGDSCIHQLISVTYEIYAFFDANPS